MKRTILAFLLSFSMPAFSQQDSATINTDSPGNNFSKKRTRLATAITIAGYGGSLAALNATWYNGYPRSGFHSFDDNGEWLQMDKVGHGWSAYSLARASSALWKWTGVSDKKAVVIGGISGAGYLTVIELLDGFSSKWGWSWADMGANVFGSGLYMAQELGWKDQRLQLKFSFHKYNYRDPQLKERAADLFGNTWYEGMLKDYNAQSYWLSANLKSFLKKSNLPPWLNIAVGYGANGMYGGYKNSWTEGTTPIDRRDIPRRRQWFLAPDIDFTRINTNSKFLRSTFFVLNAFKFPTPAMELSGGKLKLRAVAF